MGGKVKINQQDWKGSILLCNKERGGIVSGCQVTGFQVGIICFPYRIRQFWRLEQNTVCIWFSLYKLHFSQQDLLHLSRGRWAFTEGAIA